MIATVEIEGYLAVVPKIQNIYPVEKMASGVYQTGFKYESGVFEYFTYKDKNQAEKVYQKIKAAIEYYYNTIGGKQ